VLETVEGQQVWNRKALKPQKGKASKIVAFSIPSSQLKKGDYILSLKGINKEGLLESVQDFVFTINHP